MKRLAIATALLTALAAGAQAGSLPKAIRMVNKVKIYSVTHYVRGGTGQGGGGGSSMTAEARQAAPTAATASKQSPTPQPARAD